MSKPKYTYNEATRTETIDYGDRYVIRSKGTGVGLSSRSPYGPQPWPVAPTPKPLSPRQLLRQELGLDTIDHPSPKNS